MEPTELNGQPGGISRDKDGKILGTWTLEILDGQIQTIRVVNNPDKLKHLGLVADPWAVQRESIPARQPGNDESADADHEAKHELDALERTDAVDPADPATNS